MLHFLSFIANFMNVPCIQGSAQITGSQLDDFSESELTCVTSTQMKGQNPDRKLHLFQSLAPGFVIVLKTCFYQQ